MEQLSFRPLTPEDAGALAAVWSDPEVIRYTAILSPCTSEEIRRRIEALRPMDVFLIRRAGQAVGVAGCPPVDRERRVFGLFYQLRRSAWGQGVGTAAARWVLAHMERRYGAPTTIYADVFRENAASVRILRRLGFRLTGEGMAERGGETLHLCRYEKILGGGTAGKAPESAPGGICSD